MQLETELGVVTESVAAGSSGSSVSRAAGGRPVAAPLWFGRWLGISDNAGDWAQGIPSQPLANGQLCVAVVGFRGTLA